VLGIFQTRTGKIGVTLETFPRKLFQLVQQMGVFYILITDVNRTECKRTGKVNMYEVCKETSDYGKNLMVKMSGLQGLDTCCNVDQSGWLIEGFVTI
jgi:lipoate synthase